MKKTILLLVSLMLLGNFKLMAQYWVNGGNTLSSTGRFGTNNNYSVIFETKNVSRGIVTNTGNWGIGIISPSAKLHVNNSNPLIAKFTNSAGTTGNRTALIDIQNGAGVKWRYGVGGSGNGLGITNGQFYIEHSAKAVLTLTTAGNVGIGTTAPQQKLHVVGTEIFSTGHQAGFKFRNRNSSSPSDDWVWYSQGNIARFWRSSSGDLISVTASGNVGIGTINPSAKLTVTGDVHAREVRVTATAGADFVFKEDYQLRPLTEVAQYVKEHKHLPEIPSEKEMLANGLNMGEFQIKLLQKVEELTLYVIEQEKRIKKLEAENETLKNR